MDKSKKIYGVYNLIEWQAELPFGGGRVRVKFSGGAMTTQGVTPATYATSDAVVQFAIERSEAYRSGKIRLLKSYPTGERVEIGCNAASKEEPGVMSEALEKIVRYRHLTPASQRRTRLR